MSKIYCVDAKTGDKVLRDMTEAEEKLLADGITASEASKKAHDDALAKKVTVGPDPPLVGVPLYK